MYYIHDVIHLVHGVLVVQKVLGKFRFPVVVLVVLILFYVVADLVESLHGIHGENGCYYLLESSTFFRVTG